MLLWKECRILIFAHVYILFGISKVLTVFSDLDKQRIASTGTYWCLKLCKQRFILALHFNSINIDCFWFIGRVIGQFFYVVTCWF